MKNKDEHGEYERLILQARYELKANVVSKTSLGFVDPRKIEGELLWPSRFDDQALKEMEIPLGELSHAQMQQDPKPRLGSLFESDWWVRYDKPPASIIEVVQFWDCAQKPGVTNDYSVCATWARCSDGYYLLDLLREKTTAPILEEYAISKYKLLIPDAVVVEDKSAGSSLIQYLRTLDGLVIPVLAFNPKGDKTVRAIGATPTVKAGKCHLPNYPMWGQDELGNKIDLIKAFINEHERFPNVAHDDMVDTTSMMIKHFSKRMQITPRIRTL